MNCYDSHPSSSFWASGCISSTAGKSAATRIIRRWFKTEISGVMALFGLRILPTSRQMSWNDVSSRTETLNTPRIGVAVMGLIDRMRRLLARKQLASSGATELTSKTERQQFKIRQANVIARLERIRIDAEVRDQPRKDTQK